MRIAISIVLGAIAVAAIVVLGIAQFGGGMSVGTAEVVPFVRDAVDVAAADAPATGPAGNARKAPAPAAGEANAPAVDPEEPATPQVSPFSTLNEPAQPAPGQPTTADAPAAPAPAQPEAELRVAPQSVPAAADAVPASLEAQFKSRRLTYNRPPEKLTLDRAIDISLIIDTSRQTDAVGRLQGLPGTVVERDVDLSDTVTAELVGTAGFDIQLQSVSTRQKLSPTLANEWRWRVTPTQKGTQELVLSVYGFAVGSVDAELLDSYRDRIVIEVEPVGEIVTWARGVQPLFAVLAALAAVGSAIFAFLRFREEKKQTTHLTSKKTE